MSKEINLLPLPRRRFLSRQFFERQLSRLIVSLLLAASLLTGTAVAIGVATTVAGAILFPSVREDLDTAVIAYRAETRAIQKTNELIGEMMRRQSERLIWSDRFVEVLQVLPAGTLLEELSGTFAGHDLKITGQAAARSAVIVLEDKLKTLPWVQRVEAPPSNLLERLGPEFTFVLRL